METEKNEIVEADDIIVMDAIDIRTGIELEIEAARAQARMQAIADAAQIFAERMRVKYKASDEHKMNDWLEGFKRVKKE